ncbi:protein of unknown function [Candidatus Filomicrobium marinum]|nr:protein of unknown function [Candidatus Filomicrobium marinum]
MNVLKVEAEVVRRAKLRILDPQYIRNLDILDAAEAAAYLRTSRSTLANYRCYWDGPYFEFEGMRNAS